MRQLKYFFAIASMIMFAGSGTHWAFALLGCVCIGAVVAIQDYEGDVAIEKHNQFISNDLYERMY